MPPTTFTQTPPSTEDQTLGFRPLYRQLRDRLMQRIADGRWQPAQAIPSESQIAAEFGVSQGTVRKALDEMAAENILIRRQGKGTFVAEHDEKKLFFQYFKLTLDDGTRRSPESSVVSFAAGQATAEEAQLLQVAAGTGVLRLHRLRSFNGEPCVSERITILAHLFPGLTGAEIPNNLYGLYASRFGVTITSATEKLKAIAAAPEDAATLRIAPGSPVLEIDRIAFAIDGTPAERRQSICKTDRIHYLSELH